MRRSLFRQRPPSQPRLFCPHPYCSLIGGDSQPVTHLCFLASGGRLGHLLRPLLRHRIWLDVVAPHRAIRETGCLPLSRILHVVVFLCSYSYLVEISILWSVASPFSLSPLFVRLLRLPSDQFQIAPEQPSGYRSGALVDFPRPDSPSPTERPSPPIPPLGGLCSQVYNSAA